jgi:hypothetical protein
MKIFRNLTAFEADCKTAFYVLLLLACASSCISYEQDIVHASMVHGVMDSGFVGLVPTLM